MVNSRRGLGALDVFCLGLNAIIGSGIFLFPGTLAALMGPSSILAFGICGILLITVALCYAELGAMLKGNGGSALYARAAYGESVGYGVGLVAWAAALLSWAAVASILAAHLSYFHEIFAAPPVKKLIAAGGILVFGALNYRGIKTGARTVNFLTIAKVLPLAVFLLAGLGSFDSSRLTPFFSGEVGFRYSNMKYAIFLALWALQGFEVAPVPAGETEDPQRDVPKAVVGSLMFATLFYMAIQLAAVGAFGGLAAARERPLVDAAAHFMGPAGGSLLAVGGIVSMLGFIAGAALGAPRYLSAIGETSLRPWKFAGVHPRFRTPARAIVVTTGAGALMILLFDFSKLIDLSNLAVVSQYFSTCLAAIVLRFRRARAPRPYKVPGLFFVAPAGCAVSLWLMTMVSVKELAGCVAILGAGYLVRALVGGGRVTA